jgi:hypothetical protein
MDSHLLHHRQNVSFVFFVRKYSPAGECLPPPAHGFSSEPSGVVSANKVLHFVQVRQKACSRTSDAGSVRTT